jgi:hypothetical protein
MDSVTWGAYNEILSVIKFIIDNKSFGLKVQPRLDNNLGWDLKIFCDREGDPETRVSVSGFIIYLLNVPIFWRSKSQKGVTLLSTEAEYVAICEAVKELKFIYYLLSDLHIKVNLSIVVKSDNIGAISMHRPAFVLGTWIHVTILYKNSSKVVLLRSSLSAQLKKILIYLRRTLIRSCIQSRQRNFWKITVPVDRYRI